MFQVTVKNKYVGGGVQLPQGLTVRVAHDSISSPICTNAGKQNIMNAFLMQCGIDLSRCPSAISTAYLDVQKM